MSITDSSVDYGPIVRRPPVATVGYIFDSSDWTNNVSGLRGVDQIVSMTSRAARTRSKSQTKKRYSSAVHGWFWVALMTAAFGAFMWVLAIFTEDFTAGYVATGCFTLAAFAGVAWLERAKREA